MGDNHSARSKGTIEISLYLSIFFNMKACCVFSFESPHRGDSNEYTQLTIFNIKNKITLNNPCLKLCGFSMGPPDLSL